MKINCQSHNFISPRNRLLDNDVSAGGIGASSQKIVVGNKRRRNEQRKKLNFDTISTKTSTDSTEISEARKAY